MRDYLYIWHNPVQQLVVASGIEFKDFLPFLNQKGGVILLDHQSEIASYDARSGFRFTPASALARLAAEDIYRWGDFTWADFRDPSLPLLSPEEKAELLYFAHQVRPLHTVKIPGLKNSFLAQIHDDGWRLQLYYTDWNDVAGFLATVIPEEIGKLDIPALQEGTQGFWLYKGQIEKAEKTFDIDSVLNMQLLSL